MKARTSENSDKMTLYCHTFKGHYHRNAISNGVQSRNHQNSSVKIVANGNRLHMNYMTDIPLPRFSALFGDCSNGPIDG